MSQTKKKPPAAQQLIDSLLDEKTPSSISLVPSFPFDPHTFAGQDGLNLTSDTHEASTPGEHRDLVKKTSLDDSHPSSTIRTQSSLRLSENTQAIAAPEPPKPTNVEEKARVLASTVVATVVPQPPPPPLPPAPPPIFELEQDDLDSTQEPTEKLTIAHVRKKDAVTEEMSVNHWMPTEIKSTPGLKADAAKVISSAFSSAEAALKQSESLRIAQSRISELEAEVERLRRENEKLGSAGETLRRRSDELLSKTESLDAQLRESVRTLAEEKKVLRGQLQQKERENTELRGRMDEMESRLESNFKKIRVRERELEHRLEIIKMESATLISTKDKMILDLKRQIDQLTHETEYGKQKAQELFSQYKEKQETIRRVVRALRIALTILEGDEDVSPLKKVD